MEIEEVAKTEPDSIIVEPIDISKGTPSKLTSGISDATLNKAVKVLQLESVAQDAKDQIKNLYKMFLAFDATQVEINPWATDPHGKLWMIDSKINVDDNAKFRQQRLVNLRKTSVASEQTDPHEEVAVNAGLSYVALDGNIGCMVNGAGLAMATMDVIKLYGKRGKINERRGSSQLLGRRRRS
jgi:succinyl-CoA synthetase beta subunit